jgi:hypothetical protein
MNRRFPVARAFLAVVAAATALLLLSCRSTSNPVETGLVGSFSADAPSPANGSITLQPGEATGTQVKVRVSARGIDDLFGTAFWISFDNTSVAYRTYDDSASLLRDDGKDLVVSVNSTSSPGTVKVGISRIQNSQNPIHGVNVTAPRDLMVLTFVARVAVAGSPIAFVEGSERAFNSNPEKPPPLPPGNVIDGITWAGGALSAN